MEERIPLSVAAGLEVGGSPRSSVQLLGSYRHFPAQDAEPDRGPKIYLDYRWYPAPEQPQTGFFLGPFAGWGRLKLGLGDVPPAGAQRRRRTEWEAGVLTGYQAVFSRFTADVFVGPAYRWEQTTGSTNGLPYTTNTQYYWLRAGFTVGLRLKK